MLINKEDSNGKAEETVSNGDGSHANRSERGSSVDNEHITAIGPQSIAKFCEICELQEATFYVNGYFQIVLNECDELDSFKHNKFSIMARNELWEFKEVVEFLKEHTMYVYIQNIKILL